MTPADLAVFTGRLMGLQELLGGPAFSEARLALYCEAVSDLSLDALLRAMREASRALTFFPKPAELRALAQPVRDSDLPQDHPRRLAWQRRAGMIRAAARLIEDGMGIEEARAKVGLEPSQP